MRIKHYTLIIAFLAISMGIPLVQGCSDPFDEYGNGGTEMPVRDGWTSVSMSVEGLGLRNPLTRSLTPEGENSTAAERIRVLVFDKDNKFSYEAKVISYIPSGDPADKKGKGTMTLLAKNTPSGDTSTFVMLANVTRSANTDADAPRKGVTLVTPFFVVYQAIKALGVDGEHIKIGCIFTGNLPVFPDFSRYFHL